MVDTPTVTVDVTSAWYSKLNWTQVIGVLSSVLALVTGNALEVPVEQQAGFVVFVQTIQSVVTWVLRTWYTTTVTPASAAKV